MTTILLNNIVNARIIYCVQNIKHGRRNKMKDLIKGAYDLHVHSAPDVLPRKMDDIEMAQRIIDAGMAGYAIKSHYFCTAERAALINKMYPQCNALGAITLNSSVGGINPTAVEMAARAGAKIVWFPTCDSEYETIPCFLMVIPIRNFPTGHRL
jgi:hypothetical protein